MTNIETAPARKVVEPRPNEQLECTRRRIQAARGRIRRRLNAPHALSVPSNRLDILFERLQKVRSLAWKPPHPMIAKMVLSAQPGRRELHLAVQYVDGKQEDFVVRPNGQVLRGGLTNANDTNTQFFQSVLDSFVRLAPSESQPPETIRLARPAFAPDKLQPNMTPLDPPTREGPMKKGPRLESIEILDQFHTHEIARFQFEAGKGSFAGYICSAYAGGIFLDVPEWGGGAFRYLDPMILNSLGIDPSQRPLDPDAKDRLQHYITVNLLPPGITKKEFVAKGAVSLRHVGGYRDRIRDEIQALTISSHR